MTKKTDPVAEARERQAAAVAQAEAAMAEPCTPTQDELDRAKLGIIAHDPEPEPVTKAAEAAKPAGGYQTRATKAD
jgi:hypothetical protein